MDKEKETDREIRIIQIPPGVKKVSKYTPEIRFSEEPLGSDGGAVTNRHVDRNEESDNVSKRSRSGETTGVSAYGSPSSRDTNIRTVSYETGYIGERNRLPRHLRKD